MGIRSDIANEINLKAAELMAVFEMETVEELIRPLDKENREILDCLITYIFTKFASQRIIYKTIYDVLSYQLELEIDTIKEIIELKLSERELIEQRSKSINPFFIIPDLRSIEL